MTETLATGAAPVRAWFRFFRSELRLVLGRRRNLWILAVAAAFPVLIGIGLRLATHQGNGGGPDGVAFISQFAGNGVFLGFIALTLLLTLVMPLAVSVAAGDSAAGEAGHGTLRYLLAVPAGRVRILAVKYSVIVVFAGAVTLGVTGMALATGVALFPAGPVTLLSGTTVPLADEIARLVLVALYVAARPELVRRGGFGFFHPDRALAGAIAALAILVVVSEVADNVPQFAAVHSYLPTHWWNSFDALLRVPIDAGTLGRGLLSFGIYLLLSGSVAWARFATADVTC